MADDIGPENIVFTADPSEMEGGLDRMTADLAAFGQRAARMEAPPAATLAGAQDSPPGAATGPAHLGAAAGLGRRGVLGVGEDAGRVTATFDAGMAESIKQQEDADAAAARLTAGLKLQAATFGMTAHEAALYKLELAGASKESLEAARAAQAGLRERQKEKAPGLAERFATKEFGAAAFGTAGGALQAGIAASQREGVVAKPSEAIGQVGAVAGNVMGPLGPIAGSIVSTLTGVFGTLFDALTRESRIAAERAGAALASIATGARNAGQAIAGVRVDSLTADLQSIMRSAAAAANPQQNSFDGGARDAVAMQRGLETMEARAANATAAAQRVAADPQIQAQVGRVAELRVRQSSREAAQGAREGAQQERAAAGLAAAGLDAGRTADALERQAMAQRLAREASISLEEAQQRLAGSMVDLAKAQEERRQAEASRQVGESIRAGQEELELTERRFEVIRNLEPFVADMSREEDELARMRQRGAGAEVVAQRARQIETLRANREQEQRLQAGRQLTEQTRNPLETFQREGARLEELRDNGAISDEVFQRGMERAFEQAERSVGDTPVGQAAMTEGSVAAASAIARANRQQERDDPMARTNRVLDELNAMSRDQRDRIRNLAEVLERRLARPVAPPGG